MTPSLRRVIRAVVLVPVAAWLVGRAPLAGQVETYAADGRAPIEELYRSMDRLVAGGKWVMETVHVDSGLPIKVLATKRKGPAVWVLAGIHGEEPAPPNAVLRSRDQLDRLAGQGIPVVLFPLCNPVGYSKNWRYPDAEKYSERTPGHSVGDSDHLLLSKEGNPRVPKATSAQADALTRKVIALAARYPPVLSLDLHEDDSLEKGYLYSQGPKGRQDRAARAVVEKMVELKYPVLLSGKTRFDESVVDGIISDVSDGSIDELIASTQAIVGGKLRKGPSGKSVIVVETSSKGMPLPDRVRVHAEVIKMIPELFRLASP
ncbi:MAG: hypothetical protein HY748_00115 [Elusimicrobia bacterium]|nr:hypothetical protein [Elusimicrobiota bacterium]